MSTLKEKISVMQAADDGAVIQQSSKDGWVETKHPTWNWYSSEYRAQPKAVWIVFSADSSWVYDSEAEAIHASRLVAASETIKFIQVIDDDAK